MSATHFWYGRESESQLDSTITPDFVRRGRYLISYCTAFAAVDNLGLGSFFSNPDKGPWVENPFDHRKEDKTSSAKSAAIWR